MRYDQAKGDVDALEVAKLNGKWVIPSHGKYPADAKEHLADAANSLIDLKILGLAPGFNPEFEIGSKAADQTADRAAALHAAYNRFGVVDPDPNTVKASDDGVGTRVTMKDDSGHELASAIIGKPLPDQSDLCYVRKTGEEPVYVVKLDTGKLSVRFEDWIERNLLNINTMDLKKVEIKDYSITPMMGSKGQIVVAPDERGEFVLDAPSGDQPWKLERAWLSTRRRRRWSPSRWRPTRSPTPRTSTP